VAGQWFSPGPSVSSISKTDHHDITEILLKVALNTITLTQTVDHIKTMTYTHMQIQVLPCIYIVYIAKEYLKFYLNLN
jgi:hypothetical protein